MPVDILLELVKINWFFSTDKRLVYSIYSIKMKVLSYRLYKGHFKLYTENYGCIRVVKSNYLKKIKLC